MRPHKIKATHVPFGAVRVGLLRIRALRPCGAESDCHVVDERSSQSPHIDVYIVSIMIAIPTKHPR